MNTPDWFHRLFTPPISMARVNWKVAPRPALAVAHSRPPCDSMMERLIDSPMPVPSGLVVKNALKICSACSGASPTPVSLPRRPAEVLCFLKTEILEKEGVKALRCRESGFKAYHCPRVRLDWAKRSVLPPHYQAPAVFHTHPSLCASALAKTSVVITTGQWWAGSKPSTGRSETELSLPCLLPFGAAHFGSPAL